MTSPNLRISLDARIRLKLPTREFEQIYRKIYWTLHPKDTIPGLELKIVGSKTMRAANKNFRGKDKPTDVLSFNSRRTELLGSIMIDIQTARTQAKDFGHSTLREIQELFVHGVLHLLGHDHEGHREATAMAKLENHFNRLWKPSKRK